ncbi:MAG: DinB family protein [Saprospiraceae bacterium]
MTQESINRLNFILNTAPDLLMEINEESMANKPFPNKWSKKEILGHLIDSATNNHQRFVRAQFELDPEIGYDQNRWNEFNFYQKIDSPQIISFWTTYNKQLCEIFKNIPTTNLERKVKIGKNLFTVEYLIIDYVKHLEHHLKQIIDY